MAAGQGFPSRVSRNVPHRENLLLRKRKRHTKLRERVVVSGATGFHLLFSPVERIIFFDSHGRGVHHFNILLRQESVLGLLKADGSRVDESKRSRLVESQAAAVSRRSSRSEKLTNSKTHAVSPLGRLVRVSLLLVSRAFGVLHIHAQQGDPEPIVGR